MSPNCQDKLRKAANEGSYVYLFLLGYRNTTVTVTSYSVAQLLMGRALRSKVPVTILAPATVNPRQQLLQQERQKKSYYDRRARPLRTLQLRGIVRIRKNNAWSNQGLVTIKVDTPRSYWIDNETWVLRRNRKHLLKTEGAPSWYNWAGPRASRTISSTIKQRQDPARAAIFFATRGKVHNETGK